MGTPPDPVVAPPAAAVVSMASAARPDPAADVAEALAALTPLVRGTSHASALRQALTAYHNYRAANPHAVRKPYLWFVDFGLPNSAPRGWVLDMERLSVVDGPFHVAHGTGSSKTRNGVPTRFTNASGSYASSLGVYLTQETYRFSGRSGGRAYTSVGLRLKGESGAFNEAARRRGIVAHGAPYVSGNDAGRSQGCPAVTQARASRLMPMLANGSVLVVYSPNDGRWLREDPWLVGGPAAP